MPTELSVNAFTSDEHVRQVAQRISGMAEVIHHALRKLAQDLQHNNSSMAYALLTEEYALRARANILQIEAKRFARPDFPLAQRDVIATLDEVAEVLRSSRSSEEFTELIVNLVLFATSIACRNNSTISMLLGNLQQLALNHKTADGLRK